MTDLRDGETEVERYCMRSYLVGFVFFFKVSSRQKINKYIYIKMGVFPSPRFESMLVQNLG